MFDLLASNLRFLIQDGLAYSVCIAALIWGAGPERAIALTWLIIFELFDALYRFVWGANYQLSDVDMFLAGLDVVAAIAWIAIALNANRNYPLLIAALQVLALTAHLARGLIESIAPAAYVLMVTAPSWLQLLVLAAGVARHMRRKQTHGDYRDWRLPVRLGGLLPASSSRR